MQSLNAGGKSIANDKNFECFEIKVRILLKNGQ